ncbi:fluoride efflux transporter CrcB [Streptomyces thermospinosisporus]|uniref:Fluoride-specific ion channel FluC n=1 Tax=Streptomyces thermospinosisporus TaxID=161482 RepID=A0ABN1YQH6_9ACTN
MTLSKAPARPAGATRTAGSPRARTVAAVALGGGAGAAARHAAAVHWPTPAHGFPWTTLGVNIAGCALIGVLMVLLTEARRTRHPLLRPFLGTGVLGGFTTFSTYTVDIARLLAEGHARTALTCLVATPLAALTAVWLAAQATRGLLKGAGR